jgi:hypothetical protein
MYVFIFLCSLVLLLFQYKEPFTSKGGDKISDTAVEMIMANPVIEGLHKRMHSYLPFKKEFYSLRRYFRRR